MAEKLLEIDWDFTEADTAYLTHGLHPYPAKYIPQIPNSIISELSSPGEVVADIFCGSGTTLVEAMALGRHALGIDANPLACLISRAKTTRLSANGVRELSIVAAKARELSQTISSSCLGPLFPSPQFSSSGARPADQAISFWFDSTVVEELAEALSWCNSVSDEGARDVALTAFSSIIVSVSRQDSDTRYVRRKKRMLAGEVLKRFARSLESAIQQVSGFTEVIDPGLRRVVWNIDILRQPDVGRFDLVVCSPPYPNAYSYHLYHMTRMLWLGMDQPRFKLQEIGSHRKYSSKGSRAATPETFREEMMVVFEWLAGHLRPRRYVCFVVGDSIVRGERVDNVGLISTVARQCGFVEVASPERRLRESKKAFNPAIGKIKTERILVLQNVNGRWL